MSTASDWEQCESLDCDDEEEDDDEEDDEGEGDEDGDEQGEPADETDDPDWLAKLRRRLERWEDLIDLAKEFAEARAADHCDPEELGTTQDGQLIILPGIDGRPTVDVENTFQWNWDGMRPVTITVSDGTIEAFDPIGLVLGVTVEVEAWAVLDAALARPCAGFIDAPFDPDAGDPVGFAGGRGPAGATTFPLIRIPVGSRPLGRRAHGLVVRLRFPDFLYAGRITYSVTVA